MVLRYKNGNGLHTDKQLLSEAAKKVAVNRLTAKGYKDLLAVRTLLAAASVGQ